jgi:pimeloyl-ACP methyl ester carboxylesterase
MREVVFRAGADQNLIGVLTQAHDGAATPVCIFLNAGVIHRIGPHRINVKLARAVAQAGFDAVRFDLSGLGDSRVSGSAQDYAGQAVADICAVMDRIDRELGARRYVLIGICSGAYNAFAACLVDRRIVGAFMIDGYVFPSRWASAHYALGVLRHRGIGHVLGAVSRAVRRAVSRPSVGPGLGPGSNATPAVPPMQASQFDRDMDAMIGRGQRIALLFTGTMRHRYCYEGQLRDRFGGSSWIDSVSCFFEPAVTHTVATSLAQSRLAIVLLGWLASFPGVASAGASVRESAAAAEPLSRH